MSDEEAMAGAVDLLERYKEQFELVLTDPTVDPSTLRPFLTEAGYDSELSGLVGSSDAKLVGFITESNYLLQSYDREHDEVRILYCSRIADLRVIDSEGRDVTPPDRPEQGTREATILVTTKGMLIDSTAQWDGASQCA